MHGRWYSPIFANNSIRDSQLNNLPSSKHNFISHLNIYFVINHKWKNGKVLMTIFVLQRQRVSHNWQNWQTSIMLAWAQQKFDSVKSAHNERMIWIVSVWKKDWISHCCEGTSLGWHKWHSIFCALLQFCLFNLFNPCSKYNVLFLLKFQSDLIGSLSPVTTLNVNPID